MPAKNETIPLSEPYLMGRESEYLTECIESGWVSSVGAFVDKFEAHLSEFTKTNHAVATVNGTAALHTALMVSGVQPGDEVLVSNLTFIAPVNAIRHCGAIPVLIDAEPDYWQMDTQLLARFLTEECQVSERGLVNVSSGNVVKAIMPVHILGHPCDMDDIGKLANKYSLSVVEDSTESLGSFWRDQPCGSIGDIGCFSFNGNKLVTTGGGGMVVTRDETVALRARHLTTQAKLPGTEFIHDETGYNYRLTNIQAAVGCAQMEEISYLLKRKIEILERYRDAFSGRADVKVVGQAEKAKNCGWLSAIQVFDKEGTNRKSRDIQQYLSDHRIQARPLWQPMHLSPAHERFARGAYPVSETLYKEVLCLPCSVGLTPLNQDVVIGHILQFLNSHS